MSGTFRLFLLFVFVDMRCSFRRAFTRRDGRPRIGAAAALAAAILAFHAIAWPAATRLLETMNGLRPDEASPWIAAGLLFATPWLLSQSINGMARAVCDGDGLGAALAAPVPASAIFGARAAAIAVEGLASIAILIGPLADVAAWRDGPHWLALYPALAAMALAATAVGVAIACALIAVIGSRRTRLAAQILSAALGAAVALAAQAAAIAPPGLRVTLLPRMRLSNHASGVAAAMANEAARAALGDPIRLTLLCALSLALFVVIVRATAPALAAQAVGSSGAIRQAARRRAPPTERFKGKPAAAIARKEWRLLLRDPWVLSQICLQIAYASPIGFAIFLSPGMHASIGLAAAPTIVVIVCQLAASLAWMAASAEDAPDLVATAPLTHGAIDRMKLQAIAIPLALVFLPLVALLSFFDPRAALASLCFASAAATSSALLNFWNPGEGKRKDLMRRHAQSKLIGMQEHLLSIAWATAACLVLIGSYVALAPILLAAAILWSNRRA